MREIKETQHHEIQKYTIANDTAEDINHEITT